MSVNLYELAHHFEQVFRNSQEYKSLKRFYSEVIADPAAKQLFSQLNHVQNQLLQKEMQGEEIKQQDMETFKNLAAVAGQNQKIAQLMEADQRLNMLMMELNKIIAKPMDEIYSQVERS